MPTGAPLCRLYDEVDSATVGKLNSHAVAAMAARAAVFTSERMDVAIGNIGDLPAQVIEHAEAEASYVFQAMHLEVHWTSCDGNRCA
jgi:hypothetical protein